MLVQQYLPLLPELSRAAARRLATPLRVWLRSNWLYRRTLRGPLADHIVFHPWDAAPRRLEDADSFLRGRFRFYGVQVDVPDGVSCPGGGTAQSTETYAFDNETLAGTHTTLHGAVCGLQSDMKKQPFSLTLTGPPPSPIERYPLRCNDLAMSF